MVSSESYWKKQTLVEKLKLFPPISVVRPANEHIDEHIEEAHQKILALFENFLQIDSE